MHSLESSRKQSTASSVSSEGISEGIMLREGLTPSNNLKFLGNLNFVMSTRQKHIFAAVTIATGNDRTQPKYKFVFGVGLLSSKEILIEDIDHDETYNGVTTPNHRYDLKGVPSNLSVENASISPEYLENVKHLCDGSNSHIFKSQLNKQKVILKVAKMYCLTDSFVMNEFAHEVELLSRLQHSNICTLIAAGFKDTPEGKLPFMVLERLNGGTLAAKILKHSHGGRRPFTLPKYYTYALQLCDALSYLHNGFLKDGSVIHRDLKPDNIGFTDSDQLKIMDFGLGICVNRNQMESESFEMTGSYNIYVIIFTTNKLCRKL